LAQGIGGYWAETAKEKARVGPGKRRVIGMNSEGAGEGWPKKQAGIGRNRERAGEVWHR
jgi:hypothetical protein